MARYTQGYDSWQEKREISNEDLKKISTVLSKYLVDDLDLENKTEERKKEVFDKFYNMIKARFEQLKQPQHYEIDTLEQAFVSVLGKDVCDLSIDVYGSSTDNYNATSISFWNQDENLLEIWDENGKRTNKDGLNIALGLNPRDYNRDKISAMGDFIEQIQAIIDKNPDFKQLDNALLVLKNVSTKAEQDIARQDSYDFLEEKIIFEMRVEGKESKEYEIVNSNKEYSLDERDLRETDYEYKVCELLNNISKDFIENRTYEVISSQDEDGYNNECMISLDKNEWATDERQLLTKEATLYLSQWDIETRECNAWQNSALDIYDGRLYFSKELESKLDNLIEVLSSREDFDEDEFRNSFSVGIDNAVNIAWQDNIISEEIQYLLESLDLENEIAIVTRKGKDFEIYPIASPGYTDEVNIVPLHINKEKIQAVMDGLDDIKNSLFEQELDFQKTQYELSDEENKKLKELESPKSSTIANAPKRKQR